MSTIKDVREVKDKLRATGAQASCSDLRAYLKLARECGVRDSLSVASHGVRLLSSHQMDLAEDEKWTVHEQVVEASLDCGNLQRAQAYVNAVLRRFPDSIRAKRMKGMLFEGYGKYDAAEEVYNQISKEPTGASIGSKRLVALERTKGNLYGAIEALRKHLGTYPNDKFSWEELAEMYLEVGMYRQASFCYEELLMHSPSTIQYHIRYADTLYTIGGGSNIKAARAYYAEALVLSGGRSLRALYGLTACMSYEKDASSDLCTSVTSVLEEIYQESDPAKLALVREVTQNMTK